MSNYNIFDAFNLLDLDTTSSKLPLQNIQRLKTPKGLVYVLP